MAHKLSIRKTKRLRPLLARVYKPGEPPDPQASPVDQVVMTVLWVDASPAKARQAFAKLGEEFVDWNEMRVSMTAETGAVLEACGLSPVKGVALKRILSKAVEELYNFDFGALAKRPRQELRDWFLAIEGLPHPIAAAVLYRVFQYDRVLVDADIARVIRRLGLASDTATEAEIEAGLADVIPAREAHFTYEALRQHALTVCMPKTFDCRNCPLRKECRTAPSRIAELEAAARKAKRKAKAKAKPKPAPKAKPKPKARPKPPARKAAKKS
jgi:endonuclease-3